MRKAVMVLAAVTWVLIATSTYANEIEKVATYGKFDVFIKRSVIDNKIISAMAVAQSGNLYTGTNGKQYALFYITVLIDKKTNLPQTKSHIAWFIPLKNKSQVIYRIDNLKPVSNAWYTTGDICIYKGTKNIPDSATFAASLRDRNQRLAVEVISQNGNIIGAWFDIKNLGDAIDEIGRQLGYQ